MAACFTFADDDRDEFQFGLVRGWMDCRYDRTKSRVDFSREGADDADDACGRGWAEIAGDRLRGRIFIHRGDDSGFEARKKADAVSLEVMTAAGPHRAPLGEPFRRRRRPRRRALVGATVPALNYEGGFGECECNKRRRDRLPWRPAGKEFSPDRRAHALPSSFALVANFRGGPEPASSPTLRNPHPVRRVETAQMAITTSSTRETERVQQRRHGSLQTRRGATTMSFW